MKTSISYREIWRLSQPIIIGSAIESIINITDTAFLGRVSDAALGAIAIGGIFYLAFIMLGFGFGIGTQIIVARRFGEHNYSEIGRTIFHAALFLLPLAALVLLVTHWFSGSFFSSFVKSQSVRTAVMDFVNIRMYGIFFAFINILFRAFYVGVLRTKIVGLASAFVAIVNAILAYIFIFGHFGIPAMGISGAALAAVIAEFLGSLFYSAYLLKKINIAQFGFLTKFSFNKSLLSHIIQVAAPVMLQFFISFGGWFTFFLLIEKMGETPLAVSNIIRSIYMILLLPLWGFATATNSLVSYKMGSKDIDGIIPLVKKIVLLSVSSVVGLALIANVFIIPILHLYTNKIDIINSSLPVIYTISLSGVLLSAAIVLFNAVSGIGKTSITLLMEVFVMATYICWTYFVVNSGTTSISLVWGAEVIYGLFMGLLAIFYLKRGNWKLSKL